MTQRLVDDEAVAGDVVGVPRVRAIAVHPAADGHRHAARRFAVRSNSRRSGLSWRWTSRPCRGRYRAGKGSRRTGPTRRRADSGRQRTKRRPAVQRPSHVERPDRGELRVDLLELRRQPGEQLGSDGQLADRQFEALDGRQHSGHRRRRPLAPADDANAACSMSFIRPADGRPPAAGPARPVAAIGRPRPPRPRRAGTRCGRSPAMPRPER